MPNVNKNEFIAKKWQPFLKKLTVIQTEIERRVKLGYDLAQRMPSQATINALVKECYELTSEYYGAGKGNISVMYSFLIKASIAAGITFYQPLEVTFSDDKYLGLIDRANQIALGKAYSTDVRGAYIREGGKIFRGRSAIDNTIPPNIFLTHDARRILARQGMMRAVVKFINLLKHKPHVRQIENAGQLSQPAKEFLWQEICTAITEPLSYLQESLDFVKFLHEKPGQLFKDQRAAHLAQLFQSIEHGDIKVLQRATMVKITPHRFARVTFTRMQASFNWNLDFSKRSFREIGETEVLYLRPNEGHYLRDNHGMTLIGGEYTPVFKLPKNPTAFIRTNCNQDIEWMAVEAMMYNSQRELPGETAVMVGRNSYTGSSIKQTAHGQSVCATLADFPHYAAVNNPRQLRGCDATIDLIQLGTKKDASCLKIIVKDLLDPDFLEFANELMGNINTRLLRDDFDDKYNESHIDFQIQIIPTEDRFAFIIIPFATLQENAGVYTNPHTGATHVALNVTEHLHMGQAAGRWSATTAQMPEWRAHGHEYLQRLFDFTALEGMHKALRYIYNSNSREIVQRARVVCG